MKNYNFLYLEHLVNHLVNLSRFTIQNSPGIIFLFIKPEPFLLHGKMGLTWRKDFPCRLLITLLELYIVDVNRIICE